MLVLKVVSRHQDDQEHIDLFFGDSISHAEGIMKGEDLQNYPSSRQVGSFVDALSGKPFVASHVLIVSAENVVKHELLILPESACFITESGKTVDTFHSYFKQV